MAAAISLLPPVLVGQQIHAAKRTTTNAPAPRTIIKRRMRRMQIMPGLASHRTSVVYLGFHISISISGVHFCQHGFIEFLTKN